MVGHDFEFVRGIEGRHGNVDDSQVSNSAVDASRGNHDGGEGLQRVGLSVGFEHALSFENDVNFCHPLVEMSAAVL